MTNTTAKTQWTIDPSHSEIGFRVKHLMVSNVRGTFNEFEGTVNSDGEDFSSAGVSFTAKTASIDTRDEKRNAHLKSADFFDSEKFETLSFKSTELEKSGSEGQYTMKGDLTMKDVTKPVTLSVAYGGIIKDPWGNSKAIFSISGKINRKEWGLNWNAALETGGVLVSEDVWIECEVQLAPAN